MVSATFFITTFTFVAGALATAQTASEACNAPNNGDHKLNDECMFWGEKHTGTALTGRCIQDSDDGPLYCDGAGLGRPGLPPRKRFIELRA